MMKHRNKQDEKSMRTVDEKSMNTRSQIDLKLIKNQRNFDQHSTNNRSKINQNRSKIDLGGFWAPECVFGRILGGSWSGLEASWRLIWGILRRPGASWRRLAATPDIAAIDILGRVLSKKEKAHVNDLRSTVPLPNIFASA